MQEHEKWLQVAKEDLAVANVLLPQEFFTPLMYHCQQASEKALKGYLVFRKQEILKTHDLGKLVECCQRLDKDFENLGEAAAYLTPFATKFRYPTEEEIPDLEDAQLAIKQAQKIMRFVLKKIAAPGTGQSSIF